MTVASKTMVKVPLQVSGTYKLSVIVYFLDNSVSYRVDSGNGDVVFYNDYHEALTHYVNLVTNVVTDEPIPFMGEPANSKYAPKSVPDCYF